MARLLFVLTHSTEAPERAWAGVSAAAAAARHGHEVALWLPDEGVRLGVKGVAEAIASPPRRGLLESLELLVEGGATLHCPRSCFERRSFEVGALRPGARLAAPHELADLLADGWIAVPT
ncbi:MAG: DsrE family protein [Planctomycetota bacterium]